MKHRWVKLDLGSTLLAVMSPGTERFQKGHLRLIFSPRELHIDGFWSHASISHPNRYPTWEEILDVRYSFFQETADVVQILPPKSEYVNVSKNCFHLWSPTGKRITAI